MIKYNETKRGINISNEAQKMEGDPVAKLLVKNQQSELMNCNRSRRLYALEVMRK